MRFLILKYPGTWLDIEDSDTRSSACALLQNMVTGAIEACWSESGFEGALDELAANAERSAEVQGIRDRVRTSSTPKIDFEPFDEAYIKEAEETLHLALEKGITPGQYINALLGMYGKSFVYALDTIGSSLGVLCKTLPDNQSLQQIKQAWDSQFKDLRSVRNSAHHLEDRALSRGYRGKPMTAKPYESEHITTPENVLLLGITEERRYGYTSSDGTYSAVDVTPETLKIVGDVVQGVINCLPWTGPKRIEPNV